jgi:hypothetical protein
LYDVEVAGDDFERIALDPARRAGLLTQLYFLTSTTQDESDPVTRGFFVRRRLLCGDVPPPPGVQFTVTEPRGEGETTREFYERWVGDPACRGCHELGTWVGFGFEHYDALGRYRETERELAIDPTASVRFDDGSTVEYADAPEMLRQLAATPAVERCFAQHWLTFLFGRYPSRALDTFVDYEVEPGSCPLGLGNPVPCVEAVTPKSLAHEALECAVDGDGQLNLRELTLALATTDLFTSAFPCGQEWCTSPREYCLQRVPSADAGTSAQGPISPHNCQPYGANETGCDIATGPTDVCSCELSHGGATLSCRQ